MAELQLDVLRRMKQFLRVLEQHVPPPTQVEFGQRGFVFRYQAQTIHQAIILKLVRLTSALHAVRVLHAMGLLQDTGASQRMIDEFNEDVAFLAFACVREEQTKLHEVFLQEFWLEEFDMPDAPLESSQKRAMVRREKIRAYLANREEGGFDQSTRVKVTKVLAKGYSGYVHGAAFHVMEMYGGSQPHFYLNGMAGTPLWDDSFDDIKNNFLRSICSFGLAAAAFGLGDLRTSVIQLRDEFEERAGMEPWSKP